MQSLYILLLQLLPSAILVLSLSFSITVIAGNKVFVKIGDNEPRAYTLTAPDEQNGYEDSEADDDEGADVCLNNEEMNETGSRCSENKETRIPVFAILVSPDGEENTLYRAAHREERFWQVYSSVDHSVRNLVPLRHYLRSPADRMAAVYRDFHQSLNEMDSALNQARAASRPTADQTVEPAESGQPPQLSESTGRSDKAVGAEIPEHSAFERIPPENQQSLHRMLGLQCLHDRTFFAPEFFLSFDEHDLGLIYGSDDKEEKEKEDADERSITILPLVQVLEFPTDTDEAFRVHLLVESEMMGVTSLMPADVYLNDDWTIHHYELDLLYERVVVTPQGEEAVGRLERRRTVTNLSQPDDSDTCHELVTGIVTQHIGFSSYVK